MILMICFLLHVGDCQDSELSDPVILLLGTFCSAVEDMWSVCKF